MTDKGIIFSAPMVRALLDGRKTQTRRLMPGHDHIVRHASCFSPIISGRRVYNYAGDEVISEARYAPGDRLYVREAWHVRGQYADVVEVGYRASENRSHTEYVEQFPVAVAIPGKGKWPGFPKYGPSIHMPRWASRLTLTVTDVRVQRLQEISEEDAADEGIETDLWDMAAVARDYGKPEAWFVAWSMGVNEPNTEVDIDDVYRRSYASLWDSLHTKPGETWGDNPWIVAVSFDVKHGNIDRISV